MPLIRPIKIGNVQIENNLFLAPMAGVNCPAFRLICRKHGAGLVYTQMYDANSLVANEPSKFLEILPGERPVAVQLIGAKPDVMRKATVRISPFADIIDINMGCPDSDVLANKAGVFLMKHPEQIERVVKAVISSTGKPVTVKMRSGWESVNAPQVAKMLEDYGIAAITVHARTKKQQFKGNADWKVIQAVKEAVSIPVIGNGDVRSFIQAEKLLTFSGCDAIMIGRAAMGNPAIFHEIMLRREPYHSLSDKKQMFKEFLGYYEQQERQSFSELRQHAMWIFKGIKQAAKIKDEIGRIEKKESLLEYVENLKV
ncbi:MAG: tRNA-dihydrouridine synthase family protein [Candidatus Woesearchaeota archaeon]